MKRLSITLCAFALAFAAYAQDAKMDRFIDNLMSKMTLREKIGQLNLNSIGLNSTGTFQNSDAEKKIINGELGSILNIQGSQPVRTYQEIAVKKSRLGIPLLVGLDVIHGYKTILPIPLAQACSWDTAAIRRGAEIAMQECTTDGINWNYSPMVDVSHEIRWGRVAEGNGEDPFLGGAIATALVKGYQGNVPNHYNLLACVKHYALYGASEAGRDYNMVDMSRINMYNYYFQPYKAAVEAGVGSVMSSFNLVEGVSATQNKWLITDVLRHQWGFKGFLVTDYGTINENITNGMGTQYETAVHAFNAGTDMDMCCDAFLSQLETAVKKGDVREADIDAACRRVLVAKYRLGLFDDPYRFCGSAKDYKKKVYTAENRKTARDFAAETFVLLKNEGNILPLQKNLNIALIGPLANNNRNLIGCWSGSDEPDKYISLYQAMQNALKGKGTVTYAQGSNLSDDANVMRAVNFRDRTVPQGNNEQMMKEAVEVAQKSDVIVCALGESSEMSGESSSCSNPEMQEPQRKLLAKMLSLGKPVVLLYFSGRPTIMRWEQQHVPAIMNVWFGGTEAGDAICDVLFGDKVPSGKLVNTFPQVLGQVPMYYNHISTGRPVAETEQKYIKYHSNFFDVRNAPLYPFGYGLSYTTFSYSAPTLSSSSMPSDGFVTASVTVTNTGKRDADEVVQLYIRDMASMMARPVKELKGFRRIHLKAGESQTVSFKLDRHSFEYYDGEGNTHLEPGEIKIFTGPNSRDTQSVSLNIL
jgi:beta-glucosidase